MSDVFDSVELIDTHQHLLYRDALRYEWADDLPPLEKGDFGIADYQRLTAGKTVAGTIFMEVDAADYKAETRLISQLAQDSDNHILGIISSCRPESDDGFEAWLDECASLPVVGYRRILHEVADDLSQSDTFRRNVRSIGHRERTFDMVFRADQLGIAYELAMACDNTRLILDHCGVPDIASDMARGEFRQWRDAISKLASLPHVNGKLSGILAYCPQGHANAETIRPYVQHMIDSFTPNRLVWGSDWPVVNLRSSLPDWIDIFRDLIGELSPAEQRAICSGNVQRIYAGIRIGGGSMDGD
ncbi:MAG: amidohydrolase family protein [Ahrensia sp.]|nr:amidohydrolase family protein [Ahrensia sp.]